MIATLLAWIAFIFTLLTTTYFLYKYSKSKKVTHLLFSLIYSMWVAVSVLGILISFSGVVLGYEALTISLFRLSASLGIVSYPLILLFILNFTRSFRRNMLNAITLLIPTIFILLLVWFTPVYPAYVSDTVEFTFQSTYKEPFGSPVIEILMIFSWSITMVSTIYLIRYLSKLRKARRPAVFFKLSLMTVAIFCICFFYCFELTAALSPEMVERYRTFTVFGILLMPIAFALPEKWLSHFTWRVV